MEKHTESVSSHYDGSDIAGRIVAALGQAGVKPNEISPKHLAPADEVHTRGQEATEELATLTEFTPGLEVVDVGCGIGGPARYLASEFGCRVTGVDLTPGFCAAARELTEVTGLADQVDIHCASALEMPFPDARFDLAWTVQMQMNIQDKSALYREINRVLKPGGRLVFQDIVQGPAEGLHLPVPWASDPSHSYLALPDVLRQTICAAGFDEVVWRDVTDRHKAWVKRQAEKAAARPEGSPAPTPPVGIHLVLGPDAAHKRANTSRCRMEDRIGFVQGVFRKV